MKVNYQNKLDSILLENSKACIKPRLLLHVCCGPCSSYVLEYLCNHFDITVFYYNPNIHPSEEYERRLKELKDLYLKFPPAVENQIKVIECNYDPQEFYSAINIQKESELAKEKEKGERCRRCYKFRLEKAFEYAAANKFDYFCTTLSISPFKDAEKINIEGQLISEKGINGPKWLPSDFKKKGGFKRSLEISTEYNLYRQQYCGCVYSMHNDFML